MANTVLIRVVEMYPELGETREKIESFPSDGQALEFCEQYRDTTTAEHWYIQTFQEN